jgi:hypothetical protein
MGTCMANVIPCMGSSRGHRDQADRMPTTRLIFNEADPFAISLECANPRGGPVRWRVSRALLYLGVDDPAVGSVGQGDVRISVEGTEVRLELCSPAGHIVLWLPVEKVAEFLTATFNEVPLGTEADRIDWAAATQRLLERHPAG